MRSMGPEVHREELVNREISRMKTEWIKRGFFDSKIDENVAATVRSMMDVQREMQAGESALRMDAAEETEKDNGTGNDDGR